MAKPLYRKVNKLTLAEAGYIAGLIDGEGTVTLTRRHKNEHRGLAVTISNTDQELLKEILKMIGTGKVTIQRNKNGSLGYIYQVYYQQAFDLLAQIFPYLRTYKQKRVKLILGNYKKLTPRNGKYSKQILMKKERFIKDFFAVPGSRKGIVKLEEVNIPIPV